MLELIPTGSDRVVGLHIQGKIETADFDKVIQKIENQLKFHPKLRIYAEIESLEGMSPQAVWKDLKFTFQHFHDFEREAVVSDKRWLEKWGNFSNKLFSSIEVKHFHFDQKQQALEWVKG
ncbi:STAS/SEC14 domain-containing protein [Capilliphycus salinus ALCB114379]|uniref:STAS/SEC14 domain-containing protein n=1 Tax=Capilliphycus salinus TaxID=2768948 RepID=UPI0039A69E35